MRSKQIHFRVSTIVEPPIDTFLILVQIDGIIRQTLDRLEAQGHRVKVKVVHCSLWSPRAAIIPIIPIIPSITIIAFTRREIYEGHSR